MSQFGALHPMEDFFIHPTMTQDTSMETFARISVMNDSPPKIRLHHSVEKTVRPVSTIQDLFLAHNLNSNYSSEEESASSRNSQDDEISLTSEDEELVELLEAKLVTDPSIDRFLVPEELASTCHKIEHRCSRAQAVVVKHIGKPRMVSVARSLDSPTRPGSFKRGSSENFSRPAFLKREESKRSIRSQPALRFANDHTDSEPVSSVLPTPLEEPQHTEPSRPTTAGAAFDPFPRLGDIAAGKNGPMHRSVSIHGHNHATRHNVEASTPPATPARRGLRRITSTISSASSLVRRKSSASSMRQHVTPATSTTSFAMPSPQLSLNLDHGSLQMPMHSIPERSSSMHKLVPRGATERAPILILPPFPGSEDDDEDDDFGDASNIRGLQKWDRPRARQANKIRKMRPTIDGIVAGAVRG